PSLPLVRTAKLVPGPPTGAPSFLLDAPGGAEPLSLTLLMDPWGVMYFESDVLPLKTLRLPSERIEDMAQNLPAVLRVAPVLIHSHALLRSVSSPNDSGGATIELPLPMGMSSSMRQELTAMLSTSDGIDVPVKPISTSAVVPEAQVAALEGILVV
ncbi:MAG TPA: hypothetical protein PK156_44420, partial [Polyangium sp.]|nr:hypothetical protein [Polyangium sp.]